MKDNLFSQQALGKIKQIRKMFLWTAVWILIGELVLGAILILGQNWDLMIGKIQGTFFIVAVSLFVGVNNFIRMEKGNKTIQGFAITSLVTNLLGTILAVLMIWEVLPFIFYEEGWRDSIFGSRYWGSVSHITAIAKIMFISLIVAMGGFWMSNVLAIKDTVKPVKPLKMTAIACMLYYSLFFIVLVLIEGNLTGNDAWRWYALAGLAGFAFVVTALAAWIISRTADKDDKERKVVEGPEVKQISTSKTDDELRAEIEEQVRREMIEKEVRARMEAEKAKETKEDKEDM